MASERLQALIAETRNASFIEACRDDHRYNASRPLFSQYPGQDSYETRLPHVEGDSLSDVIKRRLAEAEQFPLYVVDVGCGELGVAIDQGVELFGDAIHWVGMNAVIRPVHHNTAAVIIPSGSREHALQSAKKHTATLIAGDVQYSPELLEGLTADLVLLSKVVPYLGDPWGLLAQAPLFMNHRSLLLATDVPVQSVIPELKNPDLLKRFVTYCTNNLHVTFSADIFELSVLERSDLVWQYTRGMQLPLSYSGETAIVSYQWANPDQIGPWISSYVDVPSLTYNVRWKRIESEGY